MKRVACLGLGAMGMRMARRLLDAGHQVIVYNRTEDPALALQALGAQIAKTPKEAAQRADIVLSMVRDDQASRELWCAPETGAISALREGNIAIESSTLTPSWVEELHRAIAATSAAFLDAPVVGSRPQAEAGQLFFLVGGADATLAQVRPLLLAMGQTIHHLGEVGAGAVSKLMVNAFFGVQVAALSELLAMAQAHGIPVAQSVELLGQLPVTSPALKGIGGAIAARQFAPMFPIDLVVKDLEYALQLATSKGVHLPQLETTQDIFQKAQSAGFGKDNIAGVAQLFLPNA